MRHCLCQTTYRRLRSRRSIIPICGVRIVHWRAITILWRSVKGIFSGKDTISSLHSGFRRPLHRDSCMGRCSLFHTGRQRDALALEYCMPSWRLKGDIHCYQRHTDLGYSVRQRYAALTAVYRCGTRPALPLWLSMRYHGPFHSTPSIFDCNAKGEDFQSDPLRS